MALAPRRELRPVEQNLIPVIQSLYSQGEAEAKMISQVMEAAMAKPVVYSLVGAILFQYAQIRYMYQQEQFWEPHLVQQPTPVPRVSIDLA